MLGDVTGEDGVDPDRLERFSKRLLLAAGASEAVASMVAASLVRSDLRGHNSHGTRHLPTYVEYVSDGRERGYTVDPEARSVVVSESPVHGVIDGQDGFGQVIGRECVERATEKAAESGVCVLGVRNATHLGRIGEWSERAAENGLCFAAFVYNHGRTVAPPGSAQRRYSTNPVSFGIPTFDALPFPIVFDVATSQVASGKTGEYAAREKSLPRDWTIKEDGGSVTDARAFRDGEGALLPLGGLELGYKGFGLAMVAELFGSIAGNARIHGETEYYRHGSAAMFVAIDPTLFTPRETLVERVRVLREYVDSTEFSPHVPTGDVAYGDRALLPGEPEYRVSLDRRENGIPLSDSDLESLSALAGRLGVSVPPLASE